MSRYRIFILLLIVLPGCAASPGSWNVRNFGARGDGQSKDTPAFQQALDRCHDAGGGTVVVPAGNYLIGSIVLNSNTRLKLSKESNLLGSPEVGDYPIADVRWEGRWVRGHRGLIYAVNADRIAIIGPGHITGNPAATRSSNPRGPVLIEPVNCTNVDLEEFSTQQRGLWSIHPTYCQNVIAKNLNIHSIGGRGDGIDVDSCSSVRIDSCNIDTGDDCIAIKSGRGMEGFRIAKPCQDVHITGCTLADANFACIGIGSETSGGIRNIEIDHCTFLHAKTYAIYIKSRPGRGAGLENISGQNLQVGRATAGFLRINLLTSGIQDPAPVPGDEGIPSAKNFRFDHVETEGATLVDATSISPVKPLDGLSLSNITGTCRKGIALANVRNVELRGIHVGGFVGPFLVIANTTGTGLEGAVAYQKQTTAK